MNKYINGIALFALCISFAAHAARPSVNDVQQQINALNARVNTLENQPKPELAYDGNGALIGTLLSYTTQSHVNIRIQSGYRLDTVFMNKATLYGNDHVLWYESLDCSTQPYTILVAGAVFWDKSDPVSGIYYVPLNANIATNLNLVATGSTGICTPSNFADPTTAWPALPNDPNVTGVFSAQFPAPIITMPQ